MKRLIAAFLIFLSALLTGCTDTQQTQLLAMQKYGVDSSNIHILPKPQDCDYDTAPVGKKLCHYEKREDLERAPETNTTYAVDRDNVTCAEDKDAKITCVHHNISVPATSVVKGQITAVYVSWERIKEE
jgi:hypothetical protein